MKSKTIGEWEKLVKNPTKEYKEYFNYEYEYLKNNLSKKSIALDLGCGDGRTIKRLAKYTKKFIGIDNDNRAVSDSKEFLREIKNTEIILEDAENTKFKEKTFDIIFTGLTFVNFNTSREKILKEIKRILKDEGRFIFSIYNENALKFREKAYTKVGANYRVIDEKGTVLLEHGKAISEQFSKEDIKIILEKADFGIEEIKEGIIYYMIKCKKHIKQEATKK